MGFTPLTPGVEAKEASSDGRRKHPIELTILMPCMNEARTLESCIVKAQAFLASHGVRGEVLVADNGSNDGSVEIAIRLGARLVKVERPGYGSALSGGIHAARGRYVVMGDSDASYDFSAIQPFLERLREGYQLVMGNRFLGGIAPGAMPMLHRYLGNPVLSFVGRLFFRAPVGDFHCGLRGFERESVLRLGLCTPGMEFATEMVVKAALFGLRIAEVPTTLSPDGRGRAPHLRRWRDGWRHLRFLLLYSPRWLFLYPGLFLLILGAGAIGALLPGPISVAGTTFDIHTMLYGALSVVVGGQLLGLALFAKVFAVNTGLLPPDPRVERIQDEWALEKGLMVGVVLVAAGGAGLLWAILGWREAGFGSIDPAVTMRQVIPSVTAVAAGLQVMFGAFFLGTLRLLRAR